MGITVRILGVPPIKRTWDWGARLVNIVGEPVKYKKESSGEDEVEPIWDRVFSTRVRLDVDRPLVKGNYDTKDGGVKRWYAFQYERLPTFCMRCGRLGHEEENYNWVPTEQELDELSGRL
uniref:Zinc knuckle CX2CX4HX4C domain-containing protein n=1 Tax=Nelumbo nucifera TaxID=4432 RepID=A0A822YZH1_NELNU|nr:TPA_asm: hypothetical protein HUJ06_013817 [Nelumbo nucifera]